MDPIGYVKGWIEEIARRVRDYLIEAGDFIKDIAERVWEVVKNGLKDARDWLYENVLSKMEALWTRIKTTVGNVVHEITDPISDFFKWVWDEFKKFFDIILKPFKTALDWIHKAFEHLFWRILAYAFPFKDGILDELHIKIQESTDPDERMFYYNLWSHVNRYLGSRPTARYVPGSMLETIRLMLSNPAEYQLRLAEELEKHHEDTWYKSADSAVKIAGEWGKNWFDWLTDKFYDYISAFKIPVPTEELDDRKIFKDLMADAAKGLGGLVATSVAVSLLSKAQLGPFAAILYDMSSFKYVTAGIMGALSTAAFVQPMKYFYNAKYRPYLPPFRDAFASFSRNIISKKGFQFHLKYRGIPDDYLELYDRLASDPVSPFLIRGMAEAEIAEPDLIFKYVMDRGYNLEKSIDITGSLLWLASKDYRKTAEKSVYKHLVEGYITLDEFNGQIQNIRSLKEYPVSYSTIDGETYSGKVYAPLSQEELMKISAEWDAKYDRLKERESAIKSDLRTGDIDIATAREQLAEFVKDESKINDIIRECVRELKTKEEPDRGKSIRTALKTQLRTCYKEGFITKERYDSEREAANKITDPNILEDMLAEWSAFYDDRSDQLKYFRDKAISKEITIDEFRAKMAEWGMRPYKMDLIINDVVEKILVAYRKQREKLDKDIKTLRSKLRDYQDQAATLESQISAETDERKLRTLVSKYQSTLAKASKVEEDLAAKEEELRALAA
jgi:hypothetical protein